MSEHVTPGVADLGKAISDFLDDLAAGWAKAIRGVTTPEQESAEEANTAGESDPRRVWAVLVHQLGELRQRAELAEGSAEAASERLARLTGRLGELHQPRHREHHGWTERWCVECQQTWPCQTAKAVTEVDQEVPF